MLELIAPFDQPMMAAGLVGLAGSTIGLIQSFSQRSDYGVDTVMYRLAKSRTKYCLIALVPFSLLLSAGWAAPNPPLTFERAYKDCLWNLGTNQSSSKQQQGCIIVAKQRMKEQTPS